MELPLTEMGYLWEKQIWGGRWEIGLWMLSVRHLWDSYYRTSWGPKVKLLSVWPQYWTSWTRAGPGWSRWPAASPVCWKEIIILCAIKNAVKKVGKPCLKTESAIAVGHEQRAVAIHRTTCSLVLVMSPIYAVTLGITLKFTLPFHSFSVTLSPLLWCTP